MVNTTGARHSAVRILVALAMTALAAPVGAQTITMIIDATGDGAGAGLEEPVDVATDAAGNVYLTGGNSNNVFKISPGGSIAEIVDASGDGLGNPLTIPRGIDVEPPIEMLARLESGVG